MAPASLVLLLVLGVTTGCGSAARQTANTAIGATPAAFLDHYEQTDGQVVRYDQGGDTVSEGEAYAMLIAAAIGDRSRFEAAWQWTSTHLQEPDGLLAWHWAGGKVVGEQPAADADLDAAAALFTAATAFGQPNLAAAGTRMAAAIVAREVGRGTDGPILLAGPWAAAPTPTVDPSYLALPLLNELGVRLGQPWTSLANSSAAALQQLTANGALPPDWAQVDPSGSLKATGPPDQTGSPAVYGFDAVRVPIWLAAGCLPTDQAAAARLLPVLRGAHGEVTLSLNGRPDPGTMTPVGLIAEAAAARAAGQLQQSNDLLSSAVVANVAHPTYYASALVALADLALSHRLGYCPR